MKNKQKGFTLLEIMVVVVILGLLVTLVAPNVIGSSDSAKIKKAISDITSLESALNMYRLDNGVYPTTDQGLDALTSRPSGNPEPRNYRENGYIVRLPQDPWGSDYQYISPGDNGIVDIFSLGADGQEGGEGIAADIGNWNIQDFQ